MTEAEKKAAYHKEYSKLHRAEIAARRKYYYKLNKAEYAPYNKKYYKLHKAELAANRNKHKAEYNAYQKDYYKSNQAFFAAYQKDYQRLNPEKKTAHKILNNAVKSGDIIRQPCSECGKLKAEAHHPDYNKPLEVIWLCRTHHKRLHAELKG